MSRFSISASILSADFARLGEDVSAVLAAGADSIHFDVMDNHYVPNLTIGSMVCKALRDYGITAPIDVHLMVKPVDRLITDFAKAGATAISFHPDASGDINHSLHLIREHGCKAGLAFNPEISLDTLKDKLDKLDHILLMSVNPGFGGQKFIPQVLNKIQAAHNLIQTSEHKISLAVDGGINRDNLRDIVDAGADTFVMGTAIFNTSDYTKTITDLRYAITDR